MRSGAGSTFGNREGDEETRTMMAATQINFGKSSSIPTGEPQNVKFGESVKVARGQTLGGKSFKMQDSFADRTNDGGESISNLFNGLTVEEQH